MAGTAFSPPPLSNVPAKHISVTHCKISCWHFLFLNFFKACYVCMILNRDTEIPFLPTAVTLWHCHCSTALDPLHNRNSISLLTQCSDPMQTLAASRGTVGSVGRSLAHSLSTDTAYADWRRKK